MPAAARRSQRLALRGVVLAAALALACGYDSDRLRTDSPEAPPEPTITGPSGPPRNVTPPPIIGDRPPQCPDVGCPNMGFTVQLVREQPWPPGAYFFRVSEDGLARGACSVVFEPVLGAVQNHCDGSAVPIRVQFRYDEEVQRIDAVEFLGQPRSVKLTVLTSEDAPALVELEHEIQYASYALGCGIQCSYAGQLSVRISERDAGAAPGDAGPTDAGSTDAGSADAADAAAGADDAG